jgi:hypothetical protein
MIEAMEIFEILTGFEVNFILYKEKLFLIFLKMNKFNKNEKY